MKLSEQLTGLVDGLREDVARLENAISDLVRFAHLISERSDSLDARAVEHLQLEMNYWYPVCANDIGRATMSVEDFRKRARV